MIRDVNLIGHLPLYVQGYREIKGIMDAEEPEVQLVEDISEVIKDNMFILHADEEGIKLNHYRSGTGNSVIVACH